MKKMYELKLGNEYLKTASGNLEWTLNELKKYFKNDCIEDMDLLEMFENIQDADDLMDYIQECVGHGNDVLYQIKEV